MPSIYTKWLILPLLANTLISALFLIVLHYCQATLSSYFTVEINVYLILAIFLISQNSVILPQLYRLDKKRSMGTHQERIPELVLHAFTILGGVFGAFYAQKCFRHKTRKITFKISNGIGLAVFLGVSYLFLRPI